MSKDETVLVELQYISESENPTPSCEMHNKCITIACIKLI